MGDSNITKERLQANYDIMIYGLIIGIVLVIIFMMAYNYMYPAGECFTDPNSLDPATKALLAYHLERDPIGMISPKFVGGPGKPTLRI